MSNKRDYYFCIEGKKMPNYEAMVAYLLDQDILFLNNYQYFQDWNNQMGDKTMCLFVNCNDVFAWACADAESVTLTELPHLFELVQKNYVWGSTIWTCLKRKRQPQKTIKDRMVKLGIWTEELENLPEK